MKNLLDKLQGLSFVEQAFFFLAENILLALLALCFGYFLIKIFNHPYKKISRYEWSMTIITIIINSLITIIGYQLWLHHLIRIDFNLSFKILVDFILLFMGMDLFMYIFHLLIHRTVLNRYIHKLHHKSVNPAPIDLFVLHPVETFAFGFLWLSLLLIAEFNAYAIAFYLTTNVILGIIGHLGFEPLSTRSISSFHHQHHLDEKYNFGFYTTIWDRIFGTFR